MDHPVATNSSHYTTYLSRSYQNKCNDGASQWRSFAAACSYDSTTRYQHHAEELAELLLLEQTIKENVELKRAKTCLETAVQTLQLRLTRTARALKSARNSRLLIYKHSRFSFRSSSSSQSSSASISDFETTTDMLLDLDETAASEPRSWQEAQKTALDARIITNNLLDQINDEESACISPLVSISPFIMPHSSSRQNDRSCSISSFGSDSTALLEYEPEDETSTSSMGSSPQKKSALAGHPPPVPEYLHYFSEWPKAQQEEVELAEANKGATNTETVDAVSLAYKADYDMVRKHEQTWGNSQQFAILQSSRNVENFMDQPQRPLTVMPSLAIPTTLNSQEYMKKYQCIPVGPVFSTHWQRESAMVANRTEAQSSPSSLRFPDLFAYGLAFRPAYHDQDARRMITITNLPRDICLSEVMAKVRGGYVVSAMLLNTLSISDSPTVTVVFLYGRSAANLVAYVKSQPLVFHGQRAHVTLVPTATWPLRIGLQKRIFTHGETRCLEVSPFPSQNTVSDLEAWLLLGNRTKQTWIQSVTLGVDGSVKIVFQNVDAASNGCSQLKRMQQLRSCNFQFLPDPCDAPVVECSNGYPKAQRSVKPVPDAAQTVIFEDDTTTKIEWGRLHPYID